MEESLVTFKDANEFESKVTLGLWLIVYHSPQCPHCVNFMPFYEDFAADVLPVSHPEAVGKIQIGRVDCKAMGALCAKEDIHAVPDVKIYKDGEPVDTLSLQEHSIAGLLTFVEKALSLTPHQSEEEEGKEGAGVLNVSHHNKAFAHPYLKPLLSRDHPIVTEPEVYMLTDANYDAKLQEGPWIIEYFAPWCHFCQAMAPTWMELAKAMKDKVFVGAVDCTVQRGICDRYGIRGFPTIKVHPGNGVEPTDYWADRTLEAFSKFVFDHIPVGASISAPQIDGLVQGLEAKNRTGFFLYFYKTDVPSDGYDRNFMTLVSQLDAAVDGGMYLTTDSALVNILTPYQIPSLFWYGKDGKAVQIPTESLSTASGTQAWALDQLYPTLIPVNSVTAPLVLGNDDQTVDKNGKKRLLYLSIVDLHDVSFENTLKTQLTNLSLSVKAARQDVKFAYMDGPSFHNYVTKVYGAGHDYPRFVIVDASDESFYELSAKDALDTVKVKDILDRLQKGELRSTNVHGLVGHMKKRVADTVAGTVEMASAYPLIALVAGIFIVISVILVLRMFSRSDKRRKE